MKRYHERVFFERGAVQEIKNIIRKMKDIKPSRHFIQQYENYGFTPLPSQYDLQRGHIFEYYRDERGLVSKFCVRCEHLSPIEDMVYIVSWNGTVITGWRNSKDDNHRTLDLSLYERGRVV